MLLKSTMNEIITSEELGPQPPPPVSSLYVQVISKNVC